MKKGFTLIEILVVITLLGILLIFLLPNLINFSNKIKNEIYNSKVNKLVEVARVYGEENIDLLSEEPLIIKVKDLNIKNQDKTNPFNKKIMDICELKITYDNKKINVEFIKNKDENYNERCGYNEIKK